MIHDVVCDAAAYLKELEFPTARPRTMKAERTFWEKATAVHVFAFRGNCGASALHVTGTIS
jgi:hypothetical protein